MNRLMTSRPILHAILWIVLYIALVNTGDGISEITGIPYTTGVLLLLLSAILLIYLWKNHRLTYYGLCKICRQDSQKALMYLPLLALALVQLLAGIPGTITFTDVAVASLLMIGTGFIEEVVFRGFLYRGIVQRRGTVAAILISGATFGIGHIINLLRGYTAIMQVEQIVAAIVIGIVLAMLMAITQSIVPGILFHIVFNITGSISNAKGVMQTYLLFAVLGIGMLYAAWLTHLVPQQSKMGQRT